MAKELFDYQEMGSSFSVELNPLKPLCNCEHCTEIRNQQERAYKWRQDLECNEKNIMPIKI